MGEAQKIWEDIQRRSEESKAQVMSAEERAEDMTRAMYDLANDMTYPVDQEGNVMNLHWLIPFLSFHLARCGYQKVTEAASIKQIPHPRAGQPGFAEDAVLYVPVDATGTIPPAFLAPPEDDPGAPVNEPWLVKTHITLNDETIKGGPR